jgi:diketogulonate reductase-like aldo/keto reductase
MNIPKVKLKSGNEMPAIGLGTWELRGDECKSAVKKALELGYNHIDTAIVYGNQKEIGEALEELSYNCGGKRKELFITSKVWRTNLAYGAVLEECEQILEELKIDYLDLLLIHWPNSDIPIGDTMKAFKKLVDKGKVKNVGVSNFNINHLKKALSEADKIGVKISINQVEFHPYLYQKKLLDFCKDNQVHITAYSPLSRGLVFKEPVLGDISKKISKSVSEIVLSWLMEKEIIVIPKSSDEEHLKDNLESVKLKLSKDQIKKIDSLNKDQRLINPGFSEFDF